MLINPSFINSGQNGEVVEDYEICGDSIDIKKIDPVVISLSKSKVDYTKIKLLVTKMVYTSYNEATKEVPQQEIQISANSQANFKYLTIQSSNYSGSLIFGNLSNPYSSSRKYYERTKPMQWLREQSKLQFANTDLVTIWDSGIYFGYAFIVLYYK